MSLPAGSRTSGQWPTNFPIPNFADMNRDPSIASQINQCMIDSEKKKILLASYNSLKSHILASLSRATWNYTEYTNRNISVFLYIVKAMCV
jgi:hypothetical protein